MQPAAGALRSTRRPSAAQGAPPAAAWPSLAQPSLAQPAVQLSATNPPRPALPPSLPQFLKDPKRWSRLDAKPPKGILLEGPPGAHSSILCSPRTCAPCSDAGPGPGQAAGVICHVLVPGQAQGRRLGLGGGGAPAGPL